MLHSSLHKSSVEVNLSDGSGQQWIPDTNAQRCQPSAVSWTKLTNRNGSTNAIGVKLTPTSVPNSLHFIAQNNTSRSGNYLEIAYQRRHCFLRDGNCQNRKGLNIPSVGYNIGKNAHSNGQVYANHNSYQQQPSYNLTPNKASIGGAKKRKRVRTVFTTQQMIELKLEYARTKYLDHTRRQNLSYSLQLSEETIKVWFQNRRMKDKKDRAMAENLEKPEVTSTTE